MERKMSQKTLIAYDRETYRLFPRHDHYDYNIIKPLLQSTFGQGMLHDAIVQTNQRLWASKAIQESVEKDGLVPLEYLQRSLSFSNIALDIRQALDAAEPVDVGTWHERTFKAISNAEKTRIKAEHIIKVGSALFTEKEMDIFKNQVRLSPAKLFEQFILRVADPELAAIETAGDAKKAHIFNDNMRNDVKHAMGRGNDAGLAEAEKLIQDKLALLADTDPKRLTYADALAEAQREDMAYSSNPLNRFKAGLGNFKDPLATFQQRLQGQAREADAVGGARTIFASAR